MASLRVVLALGIVLFGSYTPAVRLLFPEPVTCGMACCEENGVCYCHTKAPAADAEASPAREQAPQFEAAIISSGCPMQCAQLPAGFQKDISVLEARVQESAWVAEYVERVERRSPHFARDALLTASISPRAPPISLL